MELRYNQDFYKILQTYVTNKLNKLATGKLLPCISSFNGFSMYRIEKFVNCFYDGRVRMDLVPRDFLKAHAIAAKSPIIYKDYGHVKGRYEDCEHRAFHLQAINNNNAMFLMFNNFFIKFCCLYYYKY